MRLFRIKKLNEKGFSLHFVLPIVAIAAVAGIGAYFLTVGRAATCVGLAPYTEGTPAIGSSRAVCTSYMKRMLNDAIANNPGFKAYVASGKSTYGTWSAPLTVNGNYDDYTFSRVKQFQEFAYAHGNAVTRDGIANVNTLTLLCSATPTSGPDAAAASGIASVKQHFGC